MEPLFKKVVGLRPKDFSPFISRWCNSYLGCGGFTIKFGFTRVNIIVDIGFGKNAPGKTLPEKCPGEKIPLPENIPKGIKLPFKKIKLYLRLNMMECTIRSRNLEEFLTVRSCS